MNSKSISTQIQTPSNSYKNTFNQSPSHHLAFSFKSPLISIKRTHNPPTKAIPSNRFSTQTFYDLLGISQSATLLEIKRAYKQMALKYHPDVSPPDYLDEYTLMFIRVQEAYEILSDPETRAVYDRNFANGLHLAFSKKKGSRFETSPEGWRQLWEGQVEELRRRSAAEAERVDQGMRMSWAAWIRKHHAERLANSS